MEAGKEPPLIVDDTCPACSFDAGACYEAEACRFPIWCVLCGYSTDRYTDLDLARLEWIGSREVGRA